MHDELKNYIQDATSILITAHISPDGDSVSSSLLLSRILKLNYPDKKIVASMEEEPYGLDFLNGYDGISFSPLPDVLAQTSPDLLIVLDSNALSRITRNLEATKAYLDENKPQIAVIDHHEGLDMVNAAVHINNHSPAVTLDVYEIFIEQFGLKKPDGYAQTTLTGIYTDTGGFIHRNLNYERVFEVVPKLIADGADIERLANNLNKISQKGMEVLKELLLNTTFADDYTYSFISDETATLDNHEALVQATEAFRSQFLRNVENRPWGFIVYKDVRAPRLTYSVSFRAQSDKKDVSVIAGKLGGGGHKPAAGAKFSASNVQGALDKVLQAIEQSSSS